MTKSYLNIVLLSLATYFISSSVMAAPVFEYEINNPAGNDVAGKISNIQTSFDSGSNLLTWTHQIQDAGTQASDGFWLVLSSGPNPKGTVDQLAIFYGDADAGRLTAYEYNGQNNASSYNNPGNFLGSFALNYSHNAGVGTFNFGIDVTDLNDYTKHSNLSSNWEGAQFGEQIGIWFHPSLNTSFQYNNLGGIESFSAGKAGWHDSANQTTVTKVSEPPAIALLGLGLIALGLRRKRAASSN